MKRRTFLTAAGLSVAGYRFGRAALAASAAAATRKQGTARSTILFFLCGGTSHIDTWDMKPNAPSEYRGPFQPIETSAPGVTLCEHLPLLAQQAHHLTLVNSVGATVNTNDHHGGYYYNLTGHAPDPTFLSLGNNRTPMPDDWPFMGSVVAAKRPAHDYLTNAITLPHKPSRAPYTRPGQFAARLGIEHDPLYVQGSQDEPLKFDVPALKLQQAIDGRRLTARRSLLNTMDGMRRDFDAHENTRTWTRQQQRAISLLSSSKTTAAFDLSGEPTSLRERYGKTVNAMSLLVARRLVEAGVPFITVFWMENTKLSKKCKSAGGWDTHGNNFNCLKDNLLPEFDQCFSALIEDLADRGMIDETLLLVSSEMGRTPKIGDVRSGGKAGAGRDHWTHCLTNVMAGGGLRGGQTYGSSDRYAAYPADRPITPADVSKTVYHAMGIDELDAIDKEGRPYNLLAEGTPLVDLF